MGGIRRSTSRPFTTANSIARPSTPTAIAQTIRTPSPLSAFTRPGALPSEVNLCRFSQGAGCPIHRVFCDGWDTTKHISPVHHSELDCEIIDPHFLRTINPNPLTAERLHSPRRATFRGEPLPVLPRSWVPHPSRFLRWVGYDEAHLARSPQRTRLRDHRSPLPSHNQSEPPHRFPCFHSSYEIRGIVMNASRVFT